MSNRARAVNLLIAAVIAAAAIAVLLVSGGDDAPEREAAATPAPTAPTGTGSSRPSPEPTPTPEPVPSIRYEGGEVVGGVQEIEADQGERVRLDVISDVEEEIHVHAYDIYRDLVPGERTRLAFDADITGVIEVELHGAGEPLAELRVNP